MPSNVLPPPRYRPDIDGLRAIAVLAVVIFHAFPNWLKGGFIGVDIFFVISGYLISSIIFESLDKGTFSFAEFYARRIRRIFPALILILMTCFILGWFSLLSNEFRQISKYVAAGAGFVSNLVLWNDAGYFDNSTEKKPLLHLWSLGIEEQFYIIWPSLLWFSWKRKFNLLSITVLIALISLILNIKGVKQDAVATFYSPITRFWELLSGSLLAWINLYKKENYQSSILKLDNWIATFVYSNKPENNGATLANAMSSFGFILLVYGFWRISKDLEFPGKWAIIPITGSVLLIAAGPRAWFNKLVLSHKITVWFGLISFPLYLWHWPLLSFARISEGDTPSKYIRIFAVLLSILLSFITYKVIEKPIRQDGKNNIKTMALLVIMSILFIAGLAINKDVILIETNLQAKFNLAEKTIKRTDREEECFEIPYAYKTEGTWYCKLGDKSRPPKYFALGDSHALSLVPAMEKFASQNNVSIEFTGTSGCPPLLDIQSMRGEVSIEKYNCQKLNERIFDHIKSQNIKHVILIARWVYYTGSTSNPDEFNPISRNINSAVTRESSAQDFEWALTNTISRFSDIGVNTIVVQDNPQQTLDPKDALRQASVVDMNKMSITKLNHIQNQKHVNDIINKQKSVIVNFDDLLCNDKQCPFFKNSKSLYFDDDHLSIEGALLVYPRLEEILKNSQ
jgi:peptidoglycan/LPS O-acetylase OafA/YrhL